MMRIILIGSILLSSILLACKKDESKPIDNPSTSMAEDTIAIWTLINESSGDLFNRITDIEQKGTGQVWITSVNGSLSPFTSKISSFNYFLNNTQVIDSSTSHFLKSEVTSIGFNYSWNMYFGTQFTSTPGLSKEIIVEENGAFTNYNSPGGTGYSFENFHFNSAGLWYGSGNAGLINFSNPDFIEYDSWNSSIPYPNYIRDIIPINSQDFWFNTSNALLKKTNTGIDLVNSNINAEAMDIDSYGNLWLAGYQNVLTKFDGINTTQFSIPIQNGLSTEIRDVAVDNYDNIWIATRGEGLFKFNGSVWTHFDPTNSELHSISLTKLKVDSFGNLWIGSSSAGVIRLNKFGTNN
jgi:hypothetical protein